MPTPPPDLSDEDRAEFLNDMASLLYASARAQRWVVQAAVPLEVRKALHVIAIGTFSVEGHLPRPDMAAIQRLTSHTSLDQFARTIDRLERRAASAAGIVEQLWRVAAGIVSVDVGRADQSISATIRYVGAVVEMILDLVDQAGQPLPADRRAALFMEHVRLWPVPGTAKDDRVREAFASYAQGAKRAAKGGHKSLSGLVAALANACAIDVTEGDAGSYLRRAPKR